MIPDLTLTAESIRPAETTEQKGETASFKR